MSDPDPESENVPPQVVRGAVRELRRLAAHPPAGIKLLLDERDLTDVLALLDGPAGTPYAGGVFRVRLRLGRNFPSSPPRATFVTRIFHPNVSRAGDVCVSTLRRDWRPELGLEHALLALRCLLIAPNPESALDAEAAALLRDRYDHYYARAKLLTDIHARPAPGPHCDPRPAPGPATLRAHRPGEREQGQGQEQEQEPRAKRERPAPSAPAGPAARPARDRRRVLKRL